MRNSPAPGQNCPESICVAESRPPPCPLPSPVSEMVFLPRPCLPRMEVFGGGVFTERGLGEAMGVVLC